MHFQPTEKATTPVPVRCIPDNDARADGKQQPNDEQMSQTVAGRQTRSFPRHPRFGDRATSGAVYVYTAHACTHHHDGQTAVPPDRAPDASLWPAKTARVVANGQFLFIFRFEQRGWPVKDRLIAPSLAAPYVQWRAPGGCTAAGQCATFGARATINAPESKMPGG